MISPAAQLDRRFAPLRPIAETAVRPAGGWIRAIREALGMTTAQLAARMGVSQPRIPELERGEAGGNITVKSLERAAEALNCRLVYLLVPERPLAATIDARAFQLAARQLMAVQQTMRLENQGFSEPDGDDDTLLRLAEDLKRRPARLWDEV